MFSVSAAGASAMFTIGAFIIRIGFWGPLFYYNYNEEPPKRSVLVII